MSKVPGLSYLKIIRALQRDGWTIVRKQGCHFRLHKREGSELLKITFRYFLIGVIGKIREIRGQKFLYLGEKSAPFVRNLVPNDFNHLFISPLLS